MKNFTLIVIVSLFTLSLSGCVLEKNNSQDTELLEKISQLEKQIEQIQQENENEVEEEIKEIEIESLLDNIEINEKEEKNEDALDIENNNLSGDLDEVIKENEELKIQNERLEALVLKYKEALKEKENEDLNTQITTAEINNNEVTEEMGYITKVYVNGSENYLDIDYIQWLSAEECKEGGYDEYERQIPFCIINQNPKIRSFPISNNVVIKMQTHSHLPDGNFHWNEEISFSEFKTLFNDTVDINQDYLSQTPYIITIDENGVITNIVEQYIP